MKKTNFKLKKMWGLNRTYEEAAAMAAQKNKKILAKAEIGQEIIIDEKAIKYFGGKSKDLKYINGEICRTKPHVWFETNYSNVIKLGVKHPELAERLNEGEYFEFESNKYIYAGDGVCYYTGSYKCRQHYNVIEVWAPVQ